MLTNNFFYYIKQVLITIIFIFTLNYISGTTYYVSNSGNNANPGSEISPWQTIQYAIDNVSVLAGDIIIVKPGSYGRTNITKSGEAGKIITIKAENKPVLTWIENGFKVHGDSAWFFNYLDLIPSVTNSTQVSSCKGFKIAANYIEIDGFEISNIGSGVSNGISIGNTTYSNGNSIYFYASNISVKNNYIHNLEPEKNCGGGIVGYAANSIISGNILWKVEGGSIAFNVSSHDIVIENNDISHGMTHRLSDNLVIDGDSDAMRLFGENYTVRNNFIHDFVFNESPYSDTHNDGLQTFYYGSSSNPVGYPLKNLLFEGNFVYNVGQFFMSECTIPDGTGYFIFRNNIFAVAYAQGIITMGISNIKIYNNLFYKSRYGALGIWESKTGTLFPINVDVKNNIFVNTSTIINSNTATRPTLMQDFNLFTIASGWGNFQNGPNDIVNSDITLYPLFNDPENPNPYLKDFHYLPLQPIIDNGTPISGFSSDKDGNLRPFNGYKWDIGPYESNGKFFVKPKGLRIKIN